MALKSFKTARTAFVKNLNDILQKLNYSPASLSMKLNNAALCSGSNKSVVSASEISDWVSGKRIPSLYAAYKLCDYLRVGIDEILDPTFDLNTVVARSFAAQKSTAPKITSPVSAPPVQVKSRTIDLDDVIASISSEETANLLAPYSVTYSEISTTDSAPKKPVLKVTQADLRVACVTKHTTSTKYNDKLAYAVLTSGKTVADIAKTVGISSRSLRDYMYYSVSVPDTVAKKLLKALKSCNYATLGLKFDANKARYVHA